MLWKTSQRILVGSFSVVAGLSLAGCGASRPVPTSHSESVETKSSSLQSEDPVTREFAKLASDPETTARLNSQPIQNPERLASLPRHEELFSASSAHRSTPHILGGYVPSVSLRQHDSDIKSQGQRSTCSAFATVAAIENLTKQQQGFSYDLSVEQLWSYYQRAWEPDALTDATQYYLTTAVNWPYDPRLGMTGEPTIANPAAAGLVRMLPSLPLSGADEVGGALSRHHPVIVVVDVTQSLLNVPTTGVVAPGTAESGGAHVLELVGIAPDQQSAGYTGGGYYTLKNSWGAQAGDHGYVYLPFSYCSGGVSCSFWEIPGVQLHP